MEKTIRIASRGIAAELRDMEVGDAVTFHLSKYNYNSIRTSPGTTMIAEWLNGWRWKSKLDRENGCVTVTRTA